MADKTFTIQAAEQVALMSITAIMTGVEAAHFFSAKLPSTMTIRTFVNTPEAEEAINDGLIKANVGALIVGGLITAVSYHAKVKYWWLPGLATLGVCGFLTWSYRDDLRKSPIAQQRMMEADNGFTISEENI